MGSRDLKGGFFFQAEDGIRDLYVTGVQTCALPISTAPLSNSPSTFFTPTGRRLFPPERSAFAAPASRLRVPATWRWSASHCLRAASGVVWDESRVPIDRKSVV